MTRLRDWPGEWIGRMWLMGFLLEGLLILVLAATGDSGPQRPRDPIPLTRPATAADPDPARSGPELTITREPLPSGDTLVSIRRDSTYVVARQKGDAVQIVDASPDVLRAAASVGKAWGTAMSGVGRIVLILALVLLPTPILLVTVTLAWGVLRLIHRTPAAPG